MANDNVDINDALQSLIAKLATDDVFRDLLVKNPVDVLSSMGFSISTASLPVVPVLPAKELFGYLLQCMNVPGFSRSPSLLTAYLPAIYGAGQTGAPYTPSIYGAGQTGAPYTPSIYGMGQPGVPYGPSTYGAAQEPPKAVQIVLNYPSGKPADKPEQEKKNPGSK